MISNKSYCEFKEHIESLRQMAWTMHMDESEKGSLVSAENWRGKQFAYETILRELDRREKMECRSWMKSLIDWWHKVWAPKEPISFSDPKQQFHRETDRTSY